MPAASSKQLTPFSMAPNTTVRQAWGVVMLGASRSSRLSAETAFPVAPKGR
jgi:hypothetical protein